MMDLKVIHSVLDQLEEERGIPKEKILEAIEGALATAYKKEYGKRGQIVRAHFDIETGTAEFSQVKIVVDDTKVYTDPEDAPEYDESVPEEEQKTLYNPEHHIFLEDAKRMKADAQLDDELVFPLEMKGDYGRIAAQTAKQVIIQKIREAEKTSVYKEYGEREGEIVTGTVQRIERGNLFVDLGRATGILAYNEQIPGERYKQGERIRALLFRVEETPRGVFLRLSRSHPDFMKRLFEAEVPEILSGAVVIKSVAREAGARSKIAVYSEDDHIDPVGALVGQRGVRVSTVMSELGGEKIDIIEWSPEIEQFIEDSLSPAKILGVTLNEEQETAIVEVSDDQQSLAIGKGGQNVRLAAKLTGYRIDIQSLEGEDVAEADAEHVEIKETEEDAPVEEKETPTSEETAEETVTESDTEEASETESETSEDADETPEDESSQDETSEEADDKEEK